LDDWYRDVKVPASRLGSSLAALRFLLEQGGRWTPDERAIADTRRALYRVEDEAAVAVVDLFRAHQACDGAILKALTKTEKMRAIFAAVAHRRTSAVGRTKPKVGGWPPREDR
jgi:hypothetical protein